MKEIMTWCIDVSAPRRLGGIVGHGCQGELSHYGTDKYQFRATSEKGHEVVGPCGLVFQP